MDERRAQRMEDMLVSLTREMLPRKEFDRRFSELERNVNDGLRKIAVLETRTSAHDKTLEDLGGRMNDVEDVAADVGGHERRKGWFVPSLVTGLGVLLNATLAAITWVAGGHSHHG